MDPTGYANGLPVIVKDAQMMSLSNMAGPEGRSAHIGGTDL